MADLVTNEHYIAGSETEVASSVGVKPVHNRFDSNVFWTGTSLLRPAQTYSAAQKCRQKSICGGVGIGTGIGDTRRNLAQISVSEIVKPRRSGMDFCLDAWHSSGEKGRKRG